MGHRLLLIHLIGFMVLSLPPEIEILAQRRTGNTGSNNSNTCGVGFRKQRVNSKCLDIDECRGEKRVCRGYQTQCVNLQGSYRCRCPNKLQGNGIAACGYVIPFHQIMDYKEFSSITEETMIKAPVPDFIKKTQNQLKIRMNLQAKQTIRKVIIKTVTPIHPKKPKYNVTYDVYFKDQSVTPKDYINLFVKTRKEATSDVWIFGVSNPTPERSKCSPTTFGLGRRRIRFGTNKAPSLALSLDLCPGTNSSRASIRCRLRKHVDGTITAYYGYRSLTTIKCSGMRRPTSAPETTMLTTTPRVQNTTILLTIDDTATTRNVSTATKYRTKVSTLNYNSTVVDSPLKITSAQSTTFYQITTTVPTTEKVHGNFDRTTDVGNTALISTGYNATEANGIDVDAMIKKFLESLSDPSFRVTEEAFVKGKEIMNIIFQLVDESDTFELSSFSMGGSVSMMDLLIENPAGVQVTKEENLELALSFEKISTRVKLEGDEVFSTNSKSLSLQVSKMGKRNSGSGDGSISQIENSAGKQSNFSTVSAYLPREAILKASDMSLAEEPKAAFTLYKNASLFSTVTTDFEEIEVPQVLSASAGGIGIQNLSENFWYQMPIEMNQTGGRSRRLFKCAFLDEVKKTWSTKGCHFVSGSNPPNCTCNHLTNFALIVKNVKLPENFALDIVGKVGCSISIIGLAWMLGCYLSSPSLLKNRVNQVHAHLGLSLLAAYIVFLAGVENTDSRNGCIAIAALLHFLLLASWGWMTVESITMYRKLVCVLGHTGSTYIVASGAAAYGGAISIVAITLGVTIGWYDKRYFADWNPEPSGVHGFKTLYVSERLCWLQGYPLTFGFLVPIAVVFSLNLLSFIRISKAITCDRKKIRSSRKTTQLEEAKDFLIRAVVITFLFGLTWIFAIPITATDDHVVNLVFSWLFSIFNSLQGFFIFFFFCVRRKDVRGLWMKGFNKLTRRHARRRPNNSISGQNSRVTSNVNSKDGENKSEKTVNSNL